MLGDELIATENTINLQSTGVGGSVIDRSVLNKPHERSHVAPLTNPQRDRQRPPAPLPSPRNGDEKRPSKGLRRNYRGHALKLATVAIDGMAVIIATLFAFIELGPVGEVARNQYVMLSTAAPFIFLLAFAQQGLYVSRHISRRADELRRLFNAAALGTIVLATGAVLIKLQASSTWLVMIGAITLVLSGAGREGLRRLITRRRASGKLTRRVLLVGGNQEADELLRMISHAAELGYEVVGRLSDEVTNDATSQDGNISTVDNEPPWLGHTDDILDIAEAHDISGVIVATTDIDLETANRMVRQLTNAGLYVEMSSAMRDIASRRVTIRPLGRYPVMTVEPIMTTGWRVSLKRCFDITLSVLILTILSPIMVVAALMIRLTDGPGVFFRQTRVGRDGKEFTVFKLRTMVHNAEALLPSLMASNEAAGPMFKMTDDPRVTRVGAFLRRTSLDEVPQFFNVIRGEMSLVGPRPALPSEAAQWDDDLRERLRVKPGITGNWQVNGRFTASFEDYQRLDMFYVDNWSMITDLVILAKTVPAVLKRNGAA